MLTYFQTMSETTKSGRRLSIFGIGNGDSMFQRRIDRRLDDQEYFSHHYPPTEGIRNPGEAAVNFHMNRRRSSASSDKMTNSQSRT